MLLRALNEQEIRDAILFVCHANASFALPGISKYSSQLQNVFHEE